MRLKATIVCVHGFMNTGESTLPLARHLHRAGYRVCNFEYASEEGTIAQHTQSFLDYVKYAMRCFW
jgi:alpha-beta hydrolase superfamily lysophospholipase